jgi:glucose/arabinose dehydrogenase
MMIKSYRSLYLAQVFEGGITDIETGPDGFLYILTLNGSIYRISPVGDENKQDQNVL